MFSKEIITSLTVAGVLVSPSSVDGPVGQKEIEKSLNDVSSEKEVVVADYAEQVKREFEAKFKSKICTAEKPVSTEKKNFNLDLSSEPQNRYYDFIAKYGENKTVELNKYLYFLLGNHSHLDSSFNHKRTAFSEMILENGPDNFKKLLVVMICSYEPPMKDGKTLFPSDILPDSELLDELLNDRNLVYSSARITAYLPMIENDDNYELTQSKLKEIKKGLQNIAEIVEQPESYFDFIKLFKTRFPNHGLYLNKISSEKLNNILCDQAERKAFFELVEYYGVFGVPDGKVNYKTHERSKVRNGYPGGKAEFDSLPFFEQLKLIKESE